MLRYRPAKVGKIMVWQVVRRGWLSVLPVSLLAGVAVLIRKGEQRKIPEDVAYRELQELLRDLKVPAGDEKKWQWYCCREKPATPQAIYSCLVRVGLVDRLGKGMLRLGTSIPYPEGVLAINARTLRAMLAAEEEVRAGRNLLLELVPDVAAGVLRKYDSLREKERAKEAVS